MLSWSDKKVMVTGGAGFLGSHVVEKLNVAGCKDIFIVRSRDYDLTKEENVVRLFSDYHPDVVFHLAGFVGGILVNQERPAEFFYQNLMMGTLVLHYAWKSGIKKVIAAGAGCGYPEFAPIPLKEETFWDGFPQKPSFPYSIAKRLLHIQSMAYRKQYGFNSVVCIPGNIYGPYDNFDYRNSHVVPALVRKFVEAADDGKERVTVWGSGKPTRDFVYAGDVAQRMLQAPEVYNERDIVNLSSGTETSILKLVETVKEAAGFRGEIVWDTTKPDGQLRRCFDISKAREELGFAPSTSLQEGVKKTVDWYRAHRQTARNVT